MANTRARWAKNVPDLYDGRLSEASKYLTVAEVSAATALSPHTIRDALSRQRITRSNNALAPLSRPAVRVGNEPLWSVEQVEEAQRIIRSQGHRHLGGGDVQLPVVDAEYADERGYISTQEIAAITHMPTGKDGRLRPVHEQTIRRWVRDNGDFPPAVALRARSSGRPGVPIVVYDGTEVREFLRTLDRVTIVEPEPEPEKIPA